MKLKNKRPIKEDIKKNKKIKIKKEKISEKISLIFSGEVESKSNYNNKQNLKLKLCEDNSSQCKHCKVLKELQNQPKKEENQTKTETENQGIDWKKIIENIKKFKEELMFERIKNLHVIDETGGPVIK
jgi:hypothetical protein